VPSGRSRTAAAAASRCALAAATAAFSFCLAACLALTFFGLPDAAVRRCLGAIIERSRRLVAVGERGRRADEATSNPVAMNGPGDADTPVECSSSNGSAKKSDDKSPSDDPQFNIKVALVTTVDKVYLVALVGPEAPENCGDVNVAEK